jgi:hypothetical protein
MCYPGPHIDPQTSLSLGFASIGGLIWAHNDENCREVTRSKGQLPENC